MDSKVCPVCKKEFKTKYKHQKCCSYSCRSAGEYNSNWKGGKRKHNFGYTLVYVKNHPYANKNYVLLHRLIMEKHIGRYLLPHEVVHHKNGNVNDNRISNLELTNFKKHSSYHSKLYFTAEIRKKISIRMKKEFALGIRKPSYYWTGRKHSDDTKQKMRQVHLGKKKTEEHKKALKDGWKRRKLFLSSKIHVNASPYNSLTNG